MSGYDSLKIAILMSNLRNNHISDLLVMMYLFKCHVSRELQKRGWEQVKFYPYLKNRRGLGVGQNLF